MADIFNGISLNNVTKKYGERTALSNINLNIPAGSSFVIFGDNGAGKSTLLKVISLVYSANNGYILYNNIDSKKLSNGFRKKISFLFNTSSLYSNFSAEENLLFFASLYNIENPKQKIENLLKKFSLFKRRTEPVKYFSKGMVQKLAVARTLITEPEFIFLDEPYSGLDINSSAILTDIINELKENKKTIITVTHDITSGLNIATDVVIMQKGSIILNENLKDIDKQLFYKNYIEKYSAGRNYELL